MYCKRSTPILHHVSKALSDWNRGMSLPQRSLASNRVPTSDLIKSPLYLKHIHLLQIECLQIKGEMKGPILV